MAKISSFTARLDTEVDGTEFIVLADTDAVYNTVTASTISASTVDDSFSDSGNGLSGFKVGTSITVTGFTAGGLNTTYVVATVASDGSKITVEETLTDTEAAGNSITINGLGVNYKMTLTELSQFIGAISGVSLDAVNTWTKGQVGEVTALVDGATIDVDLSDSNNFSVTLAGNRTLNNPTNAIAGQSGFIVVKQDATGSRTLALGSNYKTPGGSGITLSTTANAIDTLEYRVRSSTEIDVAINKDWS